MVVTASPPATLLTVNAPPPTKQPLWGVVDFAVVPLPGSFIAPPCEGVSALDPYWVPTDNSRLLTTEVSDRFIVSPPTGPVSVQPRRPAVGTACPGVKVPMTYTPILAVKSDLVVSTALVPVETQPPSERIAGVLVGYS